MDYYVQTRARMCQMNVSQKMLINLFIQFGLTPESQRSSLRVRLNYALTGRRTSAKYVKLLDDINFVLDSL